VGAWWACAWRCCGLIGAGERIVAPALVPTWPTKEHVLVFVVFPLEASKAGINRFVVGAPSRSPST
jgi:hypothetical protein